MRWLGERKRRFFIILIMSQKVSIFPSDLHTVYLSHSSFVILQCIIYTTYNSMFDLYFLEGKSLEEVEAEDKEEEEEAKSIQRRLAANLSEEDYDLNMLEVLQCFFF